MTTLGVIYEERVKQNPEKALKVHDLRQKMEQRKKALAIEQKSIFEDLAVIGVEKRSLWDEWSEESTLKSCPIFIKHLQIDEYSIQTKNALVQVLTHSSLRGNKELWILFYDLFQRYVSESEGQESKYKELKRSLADALLSQVTDESLPIIQTLAKESKYKEYSVVWEQAPLYAWAYSFYSKTKEL